MREYAGGRGYSRFLYVNAARKWIVELIRINAKSRYFILDQNSIIGQLGMSWPAWRSIINGGDMKLSTFFKICNHFNIPVTAAILEEEKFQREKV
jgi:hypothetical protein